MPGRPLAEVLAPILDAEDGPIAAISARLPGSLRAQALALGYHRNQWRGWVRGINQPSAVRVREILLAVRTVYDLDLTVTLTADGAEVA